MMQLEDSSMLCSSVHQAQGQGQAGLKIGLLYVKINNLSVVRCWEQLFICAETQSSKQNHSIFDRLTLSCHSKPVLEASLFRRNLFVSWLVSKNFICVLQNSLSLCK